MRAMRMAVILAMALALLMALLAACGGGASDGAGGDLQTVEGGLPANFPDDLPLFPDLDVARSTPLGGRYVVEAQSQSPAADVVAFYSRELTAGRWQLLETDDTSEPGSTTFRFTTEGWPLDGRVLVAETGDEPGQTVVAIAVPVDAGGED